MTAPGNDYDAFAEAYAQNSDTSAWNALYERPAVLRLAGDVRGKRVLDAGCGAGPLTAELLDAGARVTGVDLSPGLLELARRRVGDAARFHRADLAGPLPLAEGSADVIIASLVLHYLEDWAPTLTEFRRILIPGGRLVISTHHPFMDHTLSGARDYFATYAFDDEWPMAGKLVRMRFWHRPLSAMTDALVRAGFALDALEEPAPDPSVEQLDPAAWASLTTSPRFLFLAAQRV